MSIGTQYWLAELLQHDIPKLIDGAHSDVDGVNRAAYLINALHLGEPHRKFVVAKIEFSECVPTPIGINMEAVQIINKKAGKRMTTYRMPILPSYYSPVGDYLETVRHQILCPL
jgi:hypothetical protein